MIEARASKSFAAGDRDGARRPSRLRASPLAWLNLLCLDAPLVAVSWQWLFARSFGVTVSGGATAALFLTAWLIYLADRFGDSVSANCAASSSLRQRFCLRYGSAWVGLIGVVSLADFVMIIRQLNPEQLVAGAVVGACAAAYLAVNRLQPSLWRVLPAKEISIGFLFAAGTVVPLAPALTSAMWSPWLLFACLCSLNCIAIALWERFLDVAQQRISVATAFPVVGRMFLPVVAILLVVAAAMASWRRFPDVNVPAWVAVSATLLAVVHVCRRQIGADTRTALADLVLLTPLAVFVIAHW